MESEINYTFENPKFSSDMIVNPTSQISENSRIVSIGDTKIVDLQKPAKIEGQAMINPNQQFVQPVPNEVPVQPQMMPNNTQPAFNGIPSQMVSDVQAYMQDENMSAQSMPVTPIVETSADVNIPQAPVTAEPQIPVTPAVEQTAMPVSEPTVTPAAVEPQIPAVTDVAGVIPTIEPVVQAPIEPTFEQPVSLQQLDMHNNPRVVNPLENPLYNSFQSPSVPLEQPNLGAMQGEAAIPNGVAPVEEPKVFADDVIAQPQTSVAPISPVMETNYNSGYSALESITPVQDVKNEQNELMEEVASLKKDAESLLEKINSIESMLSAEKVEDHAVSQSESPLTSVPVMPERPADTLTDYSSYSNDLDGMLRRAA